MVFLLMVGFWIMQVSRPKNANLSLHMFFRSLLHRSVPWNARISGKPDHKLKVFFRMARQQFPPVAEPKGSPLSRLTFENERYTIPATDRVPGFIVILAGGRVCFAPT